MVWRSSGFRPRGGIRRLGFSLVSANETPLRMTMPDNPINSGRLRLTSLAMTDREPALYEYRKGARALVRMACQKSLRYKKAALDRGIHSLSSAARSSPAGRIKPAFFVETCQGEKPRRMRHPGRDAGSGRRNLVTHRI